MNDSTRDEAGAPKVVDRATFQRSWMPYALERRLTREKAMPLMYLVCYLRRGSRVFETYWTTRRGVEAMDNTYRLLDLTVYGRQETWEDSPRAGLSC